MDSTEEDIIRQMQVRASLNLLLERHRLEAVKGPVREQFEADLRALTEAEQDSKELKSAKRQLLFERHHRRRSSCRSRSARRPSTARRPQVKDSLTKQFVKKAAESIYKELVRQKIAVEKRRPDGRERGGDPPDQRARSASRRARTARRSSRAARRRS